MGPTKNRNRTGKSVLGSLPLGPGICPSIPPKCIKMSMGRPFVWDCCEKFLSKVLQTTKKPNSLWKSFSSWRVGEPGKCQLGAELAAHKVYSNIDSPENLFIVDSFSPRLLLTAVSFQPGPEISLRFRRPPHYDPSSTTDKSLSLP